MRRVFLVVMLFGAMRAFSGSQDAYRDFRAADGKTVSGRIVRMDVKANKVTIERENKRTFTVPISAFSAEDQQYMKVWSIHEGIRSV